MSTYIYIYLRFLHSWSHHRTLPGTSSKFSMRKWMYVSTAIQWIKGITHNIFNDVSWTEKQARWLFPRVSGGCAAWEQKTKERSCCHIIWLFCLHTLKLKPPSQGQIHLRFLHSWSHHRTLPGTSSKFSMRKWMYVSTAIQWIKGITHNIFNDVSWTEKQARWLFPIFQLTGKCPIK